MALELVTEKGLGGVGGIHMESGSGAAFAAPSGLTCLRRGVGRGFCRFASQRTGCLSDTRKDLIFGTGSKVHLLER
jgi:hypothetical protein